MRCRSPDFGCLYGSEVEPILTATTEHWVSLPYTSHQPHTHVVATAALIQTHTAHWDLKPSYSVA
jgi:hypothetical protein